MINQNQLKFDFLVDEHRTQVGVGLSQFQFRGNFSNRSNLDRVDLRQKTVQLFLQFTGLSLSVFFQIWTNRKFQSVFKFKSLLLLSTTCKNEWPLLVIWIKRIEIRYHFMPETRTTYPESNMCNTQLRMLYNNFVFSREVLSGIFVAKPFFNYNSCDKRALTRIAYSRLMIPEFLGRFARFPQSGCGRALSPATVHLHINTSFDGLETFDRTHFMDFE